jgi:hypothetical protein
MQAVKKRPFALKTAHFVTASLPVTAGVRDGGVAP